MKILIKSIITSLLFIFIHLFTSCSDFENGSDIIDEVNKSNGIKLNQLFAQFNTDLLIDSSDSFSAIQQKEILSKPVIIDTMIKGIYLIDGQTYIKGYIETKSSYRILTVLKCDEDTAKKVDNFKNNRAYISADISKIKISDCIAEIKDIDGKMKYTKVGSDIFLFGNLTKAVEIHSLNFYNEDYWN
ncbi:MAG: hypothetical protein JXA68_08125 [Ignavibacteriales bacterium]|nr:hypothetical protein [Ignavibacteriales bacterium]